MKLVVRRNTFETNSSSVHTLILVPYDVAEKWRDLGEEWWLDMKQVEREAEDSGSGYGDIDMVQAPSREEHLVLRSELEERGEWRKPIPYQDDIDANWMLPLDVIDRPERYVQDDWSCIYAINETDGGYLITID